jgi:phage/plasmid-like protein (TIGR03299 family)
MTILALKDDLDWTVAKRPVWTADALGQPVQIEDRFAVIRSDNDNVLGIVGGNYEFVQNSALKGLIQPMVEEQVLQIENQGTLNRGGRVFIQAKINKEYRVLGEDYQGYITLLNGHVGTSSVAIGTSNTRVVCGNTYQMAMADLSEKFRHNVGVNDRVLESNVITNYVDNAMRVYAEKVEQLAVTTCSMTTFDTALEKVFQKRVEDIKQREQLERLFRSGAGNEGRTLYDAFNAITDFASHKGTTDANRFNYANFGQGSKLAQRAMTVLSLAAV